jgi:predicted TPR repeat methyltransferase
MTMDRPSPTRQITIDEAVAISIECLKEGRVRDAGVICRQILEVEPGHPDALHYAGVLAHHVGHPQEALALIRQSLAIAPNQADWHSNLGIVLQATGDLEGAILAFRRAIELEPAHANAHANLGVLLRAFERFDEAEASYRTAIELNPTNPNVYCNLAILLDQTGRTAEALTAYCKALTLKPSHPEARRCLALAYSVIGECEKAIEICEEWVKDEPDNPRARHALAAYSGRDVPLRAPDAYVRNVFDSFAESFEAKLTRLDYRAPALVVEALRAAGVTADGTLDVLDVGCGTGLCGPLLAPYARQLVGVDLSSGMLVLAREKQVYHDLVHGELTAYLQSLREAFDVIVTADTLVYFGALEDVVAAAARALRPGGIFVFTVEEAIDQASADYSLQPHGRYTHRSDYVERLLLEAGLDPAIARAELRKESGLPVAGLVVRGRRRVSGGIAVAHDVIGEHHA